MASSRFGWVKRHTPKPGRTSCPTVPYATGSRSSRRRSRNGRRRPGNLIRMKAVAVFPGKAGSVHLEELPEPRLDEVGGGRGVMVRVLSLGLDGTDREINEAKYGAPPPGSDFLVVGHESLGVVEEVGPNVDEFKKGDHVVCMVRRPGDSIYDRVGRPDFTTDDTYHEHGINLLHGFL